MDGYIIVKYDGKERKLKLGISALRDFEKITNKNIMLLFANMKEVPLSIDDSVTLLYCGLKKDAPKTFTTTDAEEIMDQYMATTENTLQDVMNDFIEALKESGFYKPKKAEEEADEEKKL